jgi:hypothetical protein
MDYHEHYMCYACGSVGWTSIIAPAVGRCGECKSCCSTGLEPFPLTEFYDEP